MSAFGRALGKFHTLMEETADQFTETLRQWFAFPGRLVPDAGGGRALAHDRGPGARGAGGDVPVRCLPVSMWQGAAFGVVQAVNTWAHHKHP
ncbi:hypothetical protein RHA1_ro11303 (plasmid) [Rhodococcus jostii RHA1]|uniref:Uncharacterized protein n=1 Tax=Rhodococcus jostii (strain RHA1) TaxID=101510 RepID=Q0RUT6_RHOJR|nr:hypothetical protein RHA1_ro11303 [Rhodococcus jostii RHA1]